MANKLRQGHSIKRIKMLGNEQKLSQYADDTNICCADLASVEKSLEVVENFGNLSGLKLNRKKTKSIWLEKCEKNKSNGNKQMNFNLKLRKLQTDLDMWKARDLALFGRVLIINENPRVYNNSFIQLQISMFLKK